MIRKDNYNYRLYFYKFLEKLPNPLGNFMYLFFQKLFGQLSPKKYVSSGEKFIHQLDLEQSKNDTLYIEIGTGWYPIVPIKILKECSSKIYRSNIKVISYDLRKLMSLENLNETINTLNFGAKNLSEIFYYFPEIDLTNHDFKELKDFKFENVVIFSKATLQHIPLEIIRKIHDNLKNKFPNHAVYHLINCNDHRNHTDRNLSKYDFLKYSEDEWKVKHTRFDYHNRLRKIEYEDFFKNLGYKIEILDFETLSEKELSEYRRSIFPFIDQRFSIFTDDENTAGSLFFKLIYTAH
jgi:hypothetical protein